MKKLPLILTGIALAMSSATFLWVEAAAPSETQATHVAPLAQHIGVVNFRQCVEQSKMGQNEQKQFDSMRHQMEAILEEKEKKLNEQAAKFNDSEYVDSLSPEAETKAKNDYRTLGQELSQLQSQYYQTLNQTNVKVIQKITDTISAAAKMVAQQHHLDLVMNEESFFYYDPSLDITADVVKALDDIFAKEPSETKTPAEEKSTTPVPSTTAPTEQGHHQGE